MPRPRITKEQTFQYLSVLRDYVSIRSGSDTPRRKASGVLATRHVAARFTRASSRLVLPAEISSGFTIFVWRASDDQLVFPVPQLRFMYSPDHGRNMILLTKISMISQTNAYGPKRARRKKRARILKRF